MSTVTGEILYKMVVDVSHHLDVIRDLLVVVKTLKYSNYNKTSFCPKTCVLFIYFLLHIQTATFFYENPVFVVVGCAANVLSLLIYNINSFFSLHFILFLLDSLLF